MERLKSWFAQLSDGLLFQAMLEGALSLTHIRAVVVAHGGAGWPSWAFPLSVDLFTVAGYRKIRDHSRGKQVPIVVAWIAFVLGVSMSLGCNVLSCWHDPDLPVAVAIAVWPAIAFLLCTLMSHSSPPKDEKAELQAQKAVLAAALARAQDRILELTSTVEQAQAASPDQVNSQRPGAGPAPSAAPPPITPPAPPEHAPLPPITPRQQRNFDLINDFIQAHGEPALRQRGGVKLLTSFMADRLEAQSLKPLAYPTVSKILTSFLNYQSVTT